MRIFMLLLFSGMLAAGTARSDVIGRAIVIDGDTLEISGSKYDLVGIDAPELGQTCKRDDRVYDCGLVATTALKDLSAGMPVRCVPGAGSARGNPVATCYAGTYELSGGMVFTGWALAMPRRGTRYSRIERKAKEARRGMWQGQFVTPWKWRERNRRAR